MEVSHRQKLGGLLLKPLGFSQRLAFGAVAITAVMAKQRLDGTEFLFSKKSLKFP